MHTYLVRPAVVTALILLIPLIAMQFTEEVKWTVSDFVVMGILLLITGTAIEVAAKRAGKYRVIAIAGIVFAFLWLWAELAVGVFTNWGS